MSTGRQQMRGLLERALAKRAALLDARGDWTNAFRLVHSGADGMFGVTVDLLGELVLIERHREETTIGDLAEVIYGLLGLPVFLMERWQQVPARRVGVQVAGPAHTGACWIWENGLKYFVDVNRPQHVGLFLDARLVRGHVLAHSDGKRVLNLFAYTCGFGMCAAKGGARSTVNIDNKRSALGAGEENYRANQLSADQRTFFCVDALYYLKRAVKQRGRFDLIVLDPPPRFKRRKQSDFRAERDYGTLLAGAAGLLSDGGTILAGLNSLKAEQGLSAEAIEQAGRASGRALEVVSIIGPGADFPETPERPVARFYQLVSPHLTD